MTTAAALAAFIAIASPVQDAPHLFDELGGLHMKVSTNN
jgi:hypothetical protein